MFSKALVILTFTSAAFATVFITAPTAATTFVGGQKATLNWQDDGTTPLLKDFGPAKISIYAGNAQQQTSLQLINASVDVSAQSSLDFTPDPTIGPNSSEYFIRVESLSLKDATQPQYPALAFSAKFAMSSMTGTFSAAVQAQISGQSTAPLATQPAPTNTAAPATTTAATGTSSKASSTSSAKPTTSVKSSAASMRVGWAGAILGALVGATMF